MQSWFTDRYQVAAIILVALLLVYRFIVLMSGSVNFSMDEAQYWYWSQHPDFGYFSKPPFMAWMIAAVTSIVGDSVVGVRTTALLAYPVVTAIIYYLAKRLYDSKTAFYAAAIFFTMPGVAMGNILITTDAPLLLFWSASLLLFLTVIDSNKPWLWVAMGVTVGFGLLSKYTMVFFAPSVLLLLLIMKPYRYHLRNPWLYLSAGMAVLVFLPNVIWNVQHHNPTLHHTLQISHLDQAGLQWDELAFFLLGQFGIFGFVAFSVLIIYSIQLLRNWQNTSSHRLLLFALIFLGGICLQALLGSANANWAVPTYIAAAIMVGYYLAKNGKTRLFTFAIVLNLILGSVIYHYATLLGIAGVELTRDNDFMRDTRGWRSLGNEVQKIKANYPAALMLFDSRYEMAELIYYMKPHPLDAAKWNPSGEVHDHFDLVTTLQDKIGKDFLYVTIDEVIPNQMARSFRQTTKLSDIQLDFSPVYHKNYHVFYLQDFQGYAVNVLHQEG